MLILLQCKYDINSTGNEKECFIGLECVRIFMQFRIFVNTVKKIEIKCYKCYFCIFAVLNFPQKHKTPQFNDKHHLPWPLLWQLES